MPVSNRVWRMPPVAERAARRIARRRISSPQPTTANSLDSFVVVMSRMLECLDVVETQYADLWASRQIKPRNHTMFSKLHRTSTDLRRQLGSGLDELKRKITIVSQAAPTVLAPTQRVAKKNGKVTAGSKPKRHRRTKVEMVEHRAKLAAIEALGLKRGRGRPPKGALTDRQIDRLVGVAAP